MKDRGFHCKFPGCPQTYASKYNVRRHMHYAHPDFHQFQCEVCHKVLSSRQNYRQHQHIHTGARPYVCDLCGGGYRQASQLAIHRRKHFVQARALPIFKLTDHVNSLEAERDLTGGNEERDEVGREITLPKMNCSQEQTEALLPRIDSRF